MTTLEQFPEVVAATIIKPGDTLIVAVPNVITREAAVRLTDAIKAELRDLAGVVVLAGVATVAGYRPDEAAT